MNHKAFYFTVIILCLAIMPSPAQEKKYGLSAPVALGTSGLNKVLCMKNGNTMLFHFEPDKAVIVKVFDSSHKETASQKHICQLLDINALETTIFKGVYDINGEAVLFVEEEHLSKYLLIRLRFNAADGTLTEEKIVGESQRQSKRTRYYVMKNKDDDTYAIFYCTDIPQFKECKLNVTFFNQRHEIIRDVPLTVDRQQYDAVEVLGADWQPEGTCITLNLKKVKVNGTISGASAKNGDAAVTMPVVDHDLGIFYIPKNSAVAKAKVVDVTSNVYPYYTNFTYNSFAGSLNLLLLSYFDYNYKFGTDIQPAAQKSSLFFNLDQENMTLKYSWIKNEKANLYFKQQTDSTHLFEGLPIKMFTNENGLSTVVYRSFNRFKDIESRERPIVYDSYFGDLCITQFDDDGNELWGAVLPGAQFFKSYEHYYYADEISRGWQDHAMFRDMPPQVYNRQFLSQNIYERDKNFYIIYNDYDKNFDNNMKNPGDTVYTYENTNACFYKLNRKKEITKSYLFGTPAANEYKCSFIEGADFDEKRGVYATLVQYKKNDDITLRMAWSHLD